MCVPVCMSGICRHEEDPGCPSQTQGNGLAPATPLLLPSVTLMHSHVHVPPCVCIYIYTHIYTHIYIYISSTGARLSTPSLHQQRIPPSRHPKPYTLTAHSRKRTHAPGWLPTGSTPLHFIPVPCNTVPLIDPNPFRVVLVTACQNCSCCGQG